MYGPGADVLNHHHLFHFWMVVREGGVTRASEKLNVSQPTVSGQLRELQEALGEKLLARSGRTAILTDVGRTVYRYADEIFTLGRELQEAVKGRVTHPARLAVGVTMVVPNLVAYQILKPALELPKPIQLERIQERPERLVAELAVYSLDVVLADTPAPPAVKVRAYSHLLGECGVSVFGTDSVAAPHRRRFPRSLDGAPSCCRAATRVCGSRSRTGSSDRGSGLVSSAPSRTARSSTPSGGRAGAGLFTLPSAIESHVRRHYGVRSWDGSTRSGSATTRSPSSGRCATRRWSPSPSGRGRCSPETAQASA
jgi:LysR family transcriptional activator of nhaA